MRHGLVVIGGALTALGVLVLGVGLVNLPTSATYPQQQDTVIPNLPPGGNFSETVPIPVQGGTSASLTFHFNASAPVDAFILTCTPPSGTQLPPPSCTVWSMQNKVGNVTITDASSFPYVLWVLNPGTTLLSLHVSVKTSAELTRGLPLFQGTLVLAAGGILAAIGTVAAFLGLFLRGGAFAGAPPKKPTPKAPRAPGEGSEEPSPSEDEAGPRVLPSEEPEKDVPEGDRQAGGDDGASADLSPPSKDDPA